MTTKRQHNCPPHPSYVATLPTTDKSSCLAVTTCVVVRSDMMMLTVVTVDVVMVTATCPSVRLSVCDSCSSQSAPSRLTSTASWWSSRATLRTRVISGLMTSSRGACSTTCRLYFTSQRQSASMNRSGLCHCHQPQHYSDTSLAVNSVGD